MISRACVASTNTYLISGSGTKSILLHGRLWKSLNLDLLVAAPYAPGHSALNPTEHVWAPISGELARVVLPDTLSEEMRPPAKQKLTEEKRRIKEAEMFDNICNYY